MSYKMVILVLSQVKKWISEVEWTSLYNTRLDLSQVKRSWVCTRSTPWEKVVAHLATKILCTLIESVCVRIDQLNDGLSISTTRRSHKAKYHNNCRSYYCSSRLKRARRKQDNIPDSSLKKPQVIMDIWGRKSRFELPFHLWGNRPEWSA